MDMSGAFNESDPEREDEDDDDDLLRRIADCNRAKRLKVPMHPPSPTSAE
jgi:hypothetical protein